MNKHRNTMLAIATCVLTACLMIALIPTSFVQADSPTQEDVPTAPVNEGKGPAFLEKALQREQKVNDNQVSLFDKADKLITRLQDAIQNGKTNGKDTTALEKALEEINNQITSAHAAHDKAASLLKSHAGFDDTGKVTETKLAAETIREVGKYQREVRRLTGDSIKDTLKAIRMCRQDNQVE